MLESLQNILEIVNTCENLSAKFVKEGKIENTSDYLMDAQILKMSHDLMGSTAEKMGNSDFSEEEFITALTNVFTIDNGEQNFDRIADIAVKCCKTSHFCVSMLGTFDFDAGPRAEKPKKERQRAKSNLGAVKAPENVKQLTKSDRGAEKTNLVRSEIQRVCRERQTDSLPYFEVICDPQNFMKSVEVAFQISFLVRDGLLGLRKVDDEPQIYLYDPDPLTQQTQRAHANDTVQCVMSLNTKLWQEKIKKFKIRSALLNVDGRDEAETDSE